MIRSGLALDLDQLGPASRLEEGTRQVWLQRVRLTAGRKRHIGRPNNSQTKGLAAGSGSRDAAAARSKGSRLENITSRAGKEGVVELHARAKGLPVEGAYLGANGPERDGGQVPRRDARALGEDAHEVASVVLGNLGRVPRRVRGQARLGDVDEVMLGGSVLDLTVRIPGSITRLDRLPVHTELGQLRDDDGRGCRPLLGFVRLASLLLLLRVARRARAGRAVWVVRLVGEVVLDDDGNLGSQVTEPHRLTSHLALGGQADQAVLPDLLHDLHEAELSIPVAMVLERHQDGGGRLSRSRCGLCGLTVHSIPYRLADFPKGNVGHERVTMGDFGLLFVVWVVPAVRSQPLRLCGSVNRLTRRQSRCIAPPP